MSDKSYRFAAVIVALLAVGAVAFRAGGDKDRLTVAIGYGLLLIVFVLGALIIADILRGNIDLKYLISEMDGSASMSRFQLMIFTFVIALGFFYLTVTGAKFPELSADVLTLLGLSATTYGVSKALQVSSGRTTEEPPAPSPEEEGKAKGVGAGHHGG